MLYLVTMEMIDPGLLFPPEKVPSMLNDLVLPSLDTLAKMVKDKKVVAGGVLAGQRAGAFILEAASHDEVNRLLHELPFWGMMKMSVAPLESFESRAAYERQWVSRLGKP